MLCDDIVVIITCNENVLLLYADYVIYLKLIITYSNSIDMIRRFFMTFKNALTNCLFV